MAAPAANVNDQPQQQDAPDDDDNDELEDAPDGEDNNNQQQQQNTANGGADYTRYFIVEEHEIALCKMSEDQPRAWDQCTKTQMFSMGSIEFEIRAQKAHHPSLLRMTNAFARPNQVEAAGFSTVAEIVMWDWNKGVQEIVRKALVSAESSIAFYLIRSDEYAFCIIRQLRKRKLDESPCPPLDDADAFTITVGSQNFVVSALRLQSASSVFRTMLNVCDKAERKVTLNDDDPEAFRAFLEAITPGNDVLPNPQNVRGLLKLAEKYQVDSVKKQCAQHLRYCVEIPLLERLVMADQCGLDKLKNDILCMCPYNLRAFYKATRTELHSRISRRLMDEFAHRAMRNEDDDD